MHNTSAKIAEIVGTTLVTALLAMPAAAVLIERDLIQNSGLGLLTVDTATNLEWLDLSETHRVAFFDAVNGSYSEIGFRAATLPEVALLYEHAGVFDDTGDDHVLNRLAAEQLIDLLGCSGNCDAEDAYGQGYAEMEPADPDFAEIAYVQLNPDGEMAAASVVHASPGYSKTIASYEGGTYLVRTVPEPSSWLLQLASLATVSLLQGRRLRP